MKYVITFLLGCLFGVIVSDSAMDSVKNLIDKEGKAETSLPATTIEPEMEQELEMEQEVVSELKEVKDKNITLFDKPGNCVSTSYFKVSQVLDSGMAIATEIDMKYYPDYIMAHGVRVVFVNHEGDHFYDEQIIKIPNGKCARQIGVYKYYSRTYPVVDIMNR